HRRARNGSAGKSRLRKLQRAKAVFRPQGWSASAVATKLLSLRIKPWLPWKLAEGLRKSEQLSGGPEKEPLLPRRALRSRYPATNKLPAPMQAPLRAVSTPAATPPHATPEVGITHHPAAVAPTQVSTSVHVSAHTGKLPAKGPNLARRDTARGPRVELISMMSPQAS